MVQVRLTRQRSPLAVTFLLMVGLLTTVAQRPAAAVVIDGPPVIGQDPPVPQAQAAPPS